MAARVRQIRDNARYRATPNWFRFDCTYSGGSVEDYKEGVHADAICPTPGPGARHGGLCPSSLGIVANKIGRPMVEDDGENHEITGILSGGFRQIASALTITLVSRGRFRSSGYHVDKNPRLSPWFFAEGHSTGRHPQNSDKPTGGRVGKRPCIPALAGILVSARPPLDLHRRGRYGLVGRKVLSY